MPKKWTVLVAVGLALVVVYIIYSSMEVAQVSCEVCITFRGKTECRTAAGANAAEAQRTATDVACTLMTSGMSDGIACGNTPPTRLMCKER